MGVCKYCGHTAGVFNEFHQECLDNYEACLNEMTELTKTAVLNGGDFQKLNARLIELAREGNVEKKKIKKAALRGWSQAVNQIVEEGVVSRSVERVLTEFKQFFHLSQNQLERVGSNKRLIRACIIREVLEGRLPDRSQSVEEMPFLLLEKERLIWLFTDVKYCEHKFNVDFVSKYKGIEFGDAEYYRPSSFASQLLDENQVVHLNTGLLGITNKSLHFTGPRRSFKINLSQIMSLTAFKEGLGVKRDVTSKPTIFITEDGWFTYNLVSNIRKMHL